MTETLYRVYNRCKYDIGVVTQQNIGINIKAGGFQMLSANDIAYIEANCANVKFFSQKMLVPVDDDGNEVDLRKVHVPVDIDVVKHRSDDEIIAALKGSAKKMEEWLSSIEDPAELHAIYKVAGELDLPASKLKILNSKMPNKDWLDQR